MTTVLFIRHGQSECNLSRRFAGWIDTPLTELGRKQAQSVATALQKYLVTRIYSSPLSRSIQTAKPTADLFGLEVIPEPDLCEIYAGDWEGLSFDVIEKDYPEEFDHLCNDRSKLCPPNGETMKHLFDRVCACVDRLALENRGGCIALFSHAMPLRSTLCHWNGLPLSSIKQIRSGPNASVSVAEYDDNGIVHLIKAAETDHLAEITALPMGI